MRHLARSLGTGWAICAAVAGILSPAVARADLYTFTDESGVVHFTNLPDDPRYQPHRLNEANNSFSWQDDLGRMRTVHKVNVTRYDPIIVEAARYYSLPAALVKAVIAAESAFEPAAVSSAGAQGLMQLIPKTAQAMQVRDIFTPRDNIFGGTRYLRLMANRFDGDVRKTIAAYNAGPTAVARAGGVPNIEETLTYVKRVLKLYAHYLETWPTGR